MFRRLNLYLLAGFIFSLKIAALIALIFAFGLALLTPFTGGEFLVIPLIMISAISALLGFMSCLLSFFMFNTIKIWGIKFAPQSEGYWVLSTAAFIANLKAMEQFDRILLNYYIIISVFSMGMIFLGNRIYINTMSRLDRSLVE